MTRGTSAGIGGSCHSEGDDEIEGDGDGEGDLVIMHQGELSSSKVTKAECENGAAAADDAITGGKGGKGFENAKLAASGLGNGSAARLAGGVVWMAVEGDVKAGLMTGTGMSTVGVTIVVGVVLVNLRDRERGIRILRRSRDDVEAFGKVPSSCSCCWRLRS